MSTFTGSTLGSMAARWLIITAVFELALAGLFVYLGLTIPAAAEGMFLTAAILGLTALVLLAIALRVRASSAATNRLLEHGLSGQARLTGLTQTGAYLNQNPQLDMQLLVELPGRQPYAARRKEFVPLMLLGRLGSGAPLPVRVDPTDPQKVVIDWASAGVTAAPTMPIGQPGAMPALASASGAPVAPSPSGTVDESLSQVQAALAASGAAVPPVFAAPAQASYTVEQFRDHLRQHGLEGKARIDRLTDTGKIVGNERLYTMTVTLELPGQPPEALAESAAMVPLVHAHKVRIGARVPVRVAAENHQAMMFEWERA